MSKTEKELWKEKAKHANEKLFIATFKDSFEAFQEMIYMLNAIYQTTEFEKNVRLGMMDPQVQKENWAKFEDLMKTTSIHEKDMFSKMSVVRSTIQRRDTE